MRAYPGLDYRFRLIDDERHRGTFVEAANRGLRYVFEPLVQRSSGSTASAPQKMVRRYFEEVLDAARVEALEDLFLPGCVIHRPEGELKGLAAVRSMVAGRRANFSAFKTQVHDLIESGSQVVVRLTHEGTASGPYRFRIGTHDVSNKTMRWEAIVIFRFENGKIAEEWVSRDELGMLLSAGVLQPAGSDRQRSD